MDQIAAADLDHGFDLSILSWRYAGAIVCFCHNDQLWHLQGRLREGFHRQAVLAWHKKNPMPVANKHYLPDTEFFVHAWQKGFAPVGPITAKARYIVASSDRSGLDHPTIKPVDVMDKIIGNVAGTTICDPFMGSGTTAIAAIKAGRTFTGIEIDPAYFELACRRVREAMQVAA